MKAQKQVVLWGILLLLLMAGCGTKDGQKKATGDGMARYQPKQYVELKHPLWSKNATIYEVNVRQFTPEGTFKAFEGHLQRLKEMGVDIIWLMPINPIGEKNRKGTLGSEYSVKDYLAVNPEYGTMDDFKALVKRIHSMGMYVIVDWVANHSAWITSWPPTIPIGTPKPARGNFSPPLGTIGAM